MRATEGQYQGYRVMLQAAMDGATPSEGPLNRMFRAGNREHSKRVEYEVEQKQTKCVVD